MIYRAFRLYIFCEYVCSLGIEPTTVALLTQCSTAEPHVFCDALSPQGSTGRGGAPRQQWKRILWSCRDTFRVQIGRMLVHTLSPAVPLEDRKEALEFVHEQSYSEILRESLSPGLEVRTLQLICGRKCIFVFTCGGVTFCFGYHICVSNQSTAHMHTSSVGRKTVTFHCAAADTVNNPQKPLHDTVSIAAETSSPLYCRLALKRPLTLRDPV